MYVCMYEIQWEFDIILFACADFSGIDIIEQIGFDVDLYGVIVIQFVTGDKRDGCGSS